MRKILFSVTIIFIVVFLQGSTTAKKDSYQTSDSIVYSYKKNIAPIMQTSCTPCHFPPDGRKEPLNDYETVKENISDIIKRVKLPKDDIKYMPFKSKKPDLNDSLIAVLVSWEKQKMPE